MQNWFLKFRSGDTSLRVEPRPGRTPDLDQGGIRKLVELALDFNYHNLQSTATWNRKSGRLDSSYSKWKE